MSDQIEIFKNEQFGEIRTVMRQDEPWFVGKDVAIALGYGNDGKSAINAVSRHVHDDDKGVTEIMTPGGLQKTVIINESGLYALIFGSKLPKAQDFKHWVTSEVLPTIRKHGAYMTMDTIEKVLLNPDTIIKIATALKEEQAKNAKLAAENAELKPKAEFTDKITKSKDNILIRQMAKLLCEHGYAIGEKRLYKLLRDNKILMKNNEPYQQYVDKGYFVVQENFYQMKENEYKLVHTTKVTPNGQMWIAKNLSSWCNAA